MGVNAEAWIANTFDLESLEALPDLLNKACPGPEVWIWEADNPQKHEMWTWEVVPTTETLAEGSCLIDGAGLLIHIESHVMIVHSLARWRAFLLYDDLRARVRVATAKIVRAIGATDVIWLPDWFLNDFPEGVAITMDTVRHYLATVWGPPQPSLDPIENAVVQLAEHSSPKVWFQETIDKV